MELPKLSSYNNNHYDVNALKFNIGDISIWFSYETPVAFQTPKGGLVVRQNEWNSTTGKHLNWIDGGNITKRVSSEAFKYLWQQHVEQLPLDLTKFKIFNPTDPWVTLNRKLSEISMMAVRRQVVENGRERDEWLISNGMHMGRWACLFGPYCIADNHDCLEFQKNVTEGMDVEFVPVTITLGGRK